MNAGIIVLAIGCYLFCGVSEKIYRLQTGDWITEGYYPSLEKRLSEISFIPNETTYDQVIENFGKNYSAQRTHRVFRKQIYEGKLFYFNKELRYVYREIHNVENRAAFISCSSDLELSLFFKDNVLVLYNIFDLRRDDGYCGERIGQFNTVVDKDWLPGGKNYSSSTYNCNKKFYRIFTLEHFEEWDQARDCDFKKDFKNYWSDPVYSDRQYVTKETGWPCGGIFNSC